MTISVPEPKVTYVKRNIVAFLNALPFSTTLAHLFLGEGIYTRCISSPFLIGTTSFGLITRFIVDRVL